MARLLTTFWRTPTAHAERQIGLEDNIRKLLVVYVFTVGSFRSTQDLNVRRRHVLGCLKRIGKQTFNCYRDNAQVTKYDGLWCSDAGALTTLHPAHCSLMNGYCNFGYLQILASLSPNDMPRVRLYPTLRMVLIIL